MGFLLFSHIEGQYIIDVKNVFVRF